MLPGASRPRRRVRPEDVRGVNDVKMSTVARGRGVVLAVCAGCALLSPLLVAQQQAPTFRTRTDIVQLDISILDNNRRPVRGLTAADFAVFEDGKPQEIALFEEVKADPPETLAAVWLRDIAPDVVTNQQPASRVWVIVVDDALIPADPYAITTTLHVAREIVGRLGPGDLAALVFTADSRRAQDFTLDHSKLLQALTAFAPGWAGWKGAPKHEMIDPDWQFQTGALLTLRNVVDTLSTLTHFRKSIIWISPGIPFRVPEAAQADLERAVTAFSALHRLQDVTKEIMESATLANVPVYPVHPCGLVPEVTTGACGAAAEGTRHLRMLASGTGGRPIVETNEFASGIAAVFDENASYYRIAYYPTTPRADGRLRRLGVTVTRPDVAIRTRSGYHAPKQSERTKSAARVLEEAVAVPVGIADVALQATAAVFAPTARRGRAQVAIAVAFPQPSNPPATGKPAIDLQIGAFTTEGRRHALERRSISVSSLTTGTYEGLVRLELPAGRFRLRIGAHPQQSDETGTVMVDVNVPDFSAFASTMSDVVVSVEPGRPSSPRELFAPALPVVPTAQREFSATEVAEVFWESYQQGEQNVDGSVVLRVTDAKGAEVIRDTWTIPAGQFVRTGFLKTASSRRPVPLDRVGAGLYLLTLEVSVGEMVSRRDVVFRVR